MKMKSFHIIIENNAVENAIAAFKKTLKTGKPHVRKAELVCDSVESAFEVFSTGRVATFYEILRSKPKSLSELSRTLKRDLANVWRDVQILRDLKIIELIEDATPAPKGNAKLRPVAKYDSLIFEFPLNKKASNE